MKIGYQGDLFSNSEEASIQFIKKLNLKNATLHPLISSKNVVDALMKKNIDYAVMAIKNIIAGDVIETKKALNDKIILLDTIEIPIHHCLFSKTQIENITHVVSHIQALEQTKITRKNILPKHTDIECEDTALAAKLLATNKYPNSYAVICRQNAGEYYHLTLIQKNIEDDNSNKTIFGLFKLKND